MSDQYAKALVHVALAQIAKTIGFTSATNSTFDILQDLLTHYLQHLCDKTRIFAEHCGRTDPIIDDVGLAFAVMSIPMREIVDYLSQVGSVGFPRKVPTKFPIEKPAVLNIPRPDHPELKTRPDYIPLYLPLLKPDEPKKGPVENLGSSASVSPNGLRKKNFNIDPLGDDFFSNLQDFDAEKAGLVKTVEVVEPKVPSPAIKPAATTTRSPSPETVLRPDSQSGNILDIASRLFDEVSKQPLVAVATPPVKSLKIKNLSTGVRSSLPKKAPPTVAQLAAAKAVVLALKESATDTGSNLDAAPAGHWSSSGKTVSAKSAKLQTTKGSKQAAGHFAPTAVDGALDFSNVIVHQMVLTEKPQSSVISFSIDECISSVIEQASVSSTPSIRSDQTDNTSRSSNKNVDATLDADHKRLSGIESAIEQVCLSTQSLLAEANASSSNSSSAGEVPNIPSSPPPPPALLVPVFEKVESFSVVDTPEPTGECPAEEPAEVQQTVAITPPPVTADEAKIQHAVAENTFERLFSANVSRKLPKGKDAKKRKLQTKPLSSVATKRAAPPPMPTVDTSNLFKPDTAVPSRASPCPPADIVATKKVAPLVVHKPKNIIVEKSAASPSTSRSNSTTPVPPPPATAAAPAPTPAAGPKKLGPLKIKLNLPSCTKTVKTLDSSSIPLKIINSSSTTLVANTKSNDGGGSITSSKQRQQESSKKRKLAGGADANDDGSPGGGSGVSSPAWASLIPRSKKRAKIVEQMPSTSSSSRDQPTDDDQTTTTTKPRKGISIKIKEERLTATKETSIKSTFTSRKPKAGPQAAKLSTKVTRRITPKIEAPKVPKLILKLGLPKSKNDSQLAEDEVDVVRPPSSGCQVPRSVSRPSSRVFNDTPDAVSVHSISGPRSPSYDWPATAAPVEDEDHHVTAVERHFSPIVVGSTPPVSPPPPTPSPRSLSPSGSPRHVFPSPKCREDERDQDSRSLAEEKRIIFDSGPIIPIVDQQLFIEEHVEWPAEQSETLDTNESMLKVEIESEKDPNEQSVEPKSEEVDDKIWYCPVCQVPYEDGVDMIACDKCDNWFHWTCVGLTKAPPEDEPWFCDSCNTKKSKVGCRKKSKK